MTREEELFIKRIEELAETAYSRNRFTFTGFLGLAEQDLFLRAAAEKRYVPYKFFGGREGCERVVGRFGSEELCGYEEPFPIRCIHIEPLSQKFAETLGHRDYLGALVHLGIDRSTLGDIFIKDNSAWLCCLDAISAFIADNLTKIRHTPVKCTPADSMPDDLGPVLESLDVTAASERLDAVTAALFHLSRGASRELFRAGKIFVNGRMTENTSCRLKPGDLISVRGFGRFYYDGMEGETRKGRARTAVRLFKS